MQKCKLQHLLIKTQNTRKMRIFYKTIFIAPDKSLVCKDLSLFNIHFIKRNVNSLPFIHDFANCLDSSRYWKK